MPVSVTRKTHRKSHTRGCLADGTGFFVIMRIIFRHEFLLQPVMTAVEIHYCVPCGHLERAQQVQRELLEEYGLELEEVRLKTGTNGVFTVSVDGTTVYDKAEDGSLDLNEIKESIAATA